MLGLGRILISDLVVANLLMYSLPVMILIYLAVPFFYTEGVLDEMMIYQIDPNFCGLKFCNSCHFALKVNFVIQQ